MKGFRADFEIDRKKTVDIQSVCKCILHDDCALKNGADILQPTDSKHAIGNIICKMPFDFARQS